MERKGLNNIDPYHELRRWQEMMRLAMEQMFQDCSVKTMSVEEIDRHMGLPPGLVPCDGRTFPMPKGLLIPTTEVSEDEIARVRSEFKAAMTPTTQIIVDPAEVNDAVLKKLYPRSSPGDIIVHHDTNYIFQYGRWEVYKGPIDLTPDCECGKDKHGFAAHMRFCSKFERF